MSRLKQSTHVRQKERKSQSLQSRFAALSSSHRCVTMIAEDRRVEINVLRNRLRACTQSGGRLDLFAAHALAGLLANPARYTNLVLNQGESIDAFMANTAMRAHFVALELRQMIDNGEASDPSSDADSVSDVTESDKAAGVSYPNPSSSLTPRSFQGMSQFQHTLFYDDHASLIAELERLLAKLLAEVEQMDYMAVRERYSHLTAASFVMRLKRFEATGQTFPHTKTSVGGRYKTIYVTRALDACLSQPLLRGKRKALHQGPSVK